MMTAIKTWVLIVLLLTPTIHVHAWPIPDTGQTKCYDTSWADIICPSPGQAFYGQDSSYTIDPPSYTKLDASGAVLAESAETWAMVKDNVTGLIWENKTADGTLHDGGKTFTWCDPNPATSGGSQGTCGTGTGDAATDTAAFIKALNDGRFGGFSDWRMPNMKELESILDMDRTSPDVNTTWFPNTVSSYYWSSTTYAYNTTYAWRVSFSEGDNAYILKSDSIPASHAVRGVRGGQSGAAGHWVANGDGTVTDTTTGLMWQEGSSPMTWEAALAYAEGLTLADYDDWRLPTLKELQSIVDYSHYNPAIDAALFPGTVSSVVSSYWSSTTPTLVTYRARAVAFYNGDDSINYKSESREVRLVRGGQPQVSGNVVLTEPRRAARWNIGERKTVAWDTAGLGGYIKITLSRQGGKPGTFTEVIAESVPNNGFYAWNVTGPETFNGALRIEPVSDPSKGTTQGLFTITNLLKVSIAEEKQGDTGHYKLTLTGQYADGPRPLEANFTSSDVYTATVNPYGFLTALKNGYVEVSTVYNVVTYKKGLFVYTGGATLESFSNNTKETATAMTEGNFYKGILQQGDMDYFKFNLPGSSKVSIAFLSLSTSADVKVEVFTASDALVASGISTNGVPLTFPLGLSAGDYYLKVTSAGDIDQANNYMVTYKIMGNLPAKSAIPIGIGETKQGVINSLTDTTDFTFTLAQNQGIKLTFLPTGDLGKYLLALLDSQGNTLDQIDCLNYAPVSLEGIYPMGSYALRVSPLGAVDAGSPFSVALAASDTQLETEINDTIPQATSWDITRPINGRLSSSNADTDVYAFTLSTPRYLDLLFSSPDGTGPFTLTLYKESEQYQIDGMTIDAGQSATLPMGLGIGRYYLKVNSTSPDTVHSYTLTFQNSTQSNLEIESNNTRKFANAIEKNKTMRGRIYASTDLDFYGFNLPAGGAFTIQFTPTSTTADYKVTLMDEGGNGETYQSVNGQAVNTPIEAPAGNYYLEIEPNGDIDQTNPYELTLTGTATIVGIKGMVGVTVSGENSALTPAQTRNLTAQVSYSDASTTNVTTGATWTSLNPGIATVNTEGRVTAIAQGTTSIVASYGELSGKFDLTVGAPQNVVNQHYGNLLLVAGGGIAATNTLKESTQYLSDLVYRRFKARLFTDEDIYYFNPMPFHDLNGDGFGENIADDTAPTVAKFGNAIAQWATAQSTDGPLFVYLIDHGGIDNFMLFPGEIVTAEQLKGWLDAFQTATGRKVVVVIEACKSGSFTDNLVVPGQDRVVVTSTNDQDSYIQLGGRISFSQFFVDRLLTGDSLNQAYLKAKQQLANMGLPYSNMQPKLVEGVSLSSNTTRLGGDFAIASLFPEITETSFNTNVTANTTQNFYAQLSSLEGIETVWAVVVPPDYILPDPSQNLEAPTVTLPTITLIDPEKDKHYEGSYSDFTYNGDYRITFYARNTNGNVSVSPSITVTVTGGLNTGTPGDVNGDKAITLADAILALQITAGITPTGTVTTTGDVNNDGKIGLPEVIYILQTIATIRTSGSGPTAPAGMVLIPAGSFQMGDAIDGNSETIPVHTVTVSAFYLDKYEVTKALWDEVYTWSTGHGYSFDNIGAGTAANHPVQTVSWYDVIKWLNARSEKEGRTPVYYTTADQATVYRTGQVDVAAGAVKWTANGYRLPTEAEWEYAARAGTTTRFYTGDCISTDQANYHGSYPWTGCPAGQFRGGTTGVGSYPANPVGLYDMAGNVFEWTWDWYRSYTSADVTNPKGPDSGSYRVYRGGGWQGSASALRSAVRYYYPTTSKDLDRGFRSALSQP